MATELSTGTLLVADDDEQLRFILVAHLRAAGFEVLEAANGVSAVEIASSRLPDLIIMDVTMPDMDGIAATRALTSNPKTAGIPVVMLTALSRPEDVIRGMEAGAQEYLTKPFALTELLARVRTVHRLAVAHRDLDRLNARLEVEVDVKTRRLRMLYDFMRSLNQANTRDRILDLVVNFVRETTGAERITLFLTDAAGRSLVCERAIGVDPSVLQPIPVETLSGITGRVFRSGKTVAARAYSANDDRDRGYNRDAFLSTPLVSTSLETQDGSIGVLNVTNKADDSPFSEEEIECIRSITDAAAIALDNVTRRVRLQHSVRVLLKTVGHLAEYRDEETTLHLERVAKMAKVLAEQLRVAGPYTSLITGDYVDSLVLAAPLHDIGKVGIADEILTKPGKLTDEEYQIMKTHADIGRRVLSQAVDPQCPVPLLEMCIEIAHCHHERYDGTGYPQRLKGPKIPLAARIVALVDAYDAMTSRRRYKKAQPHEAAADIIRQEAGRHFDPAIVDAFLRCHDQFQMLRARYDESLEAQPALT